MNLFPDDFPEPVAPIPFDVTTVADLICERCKRESRFWSGEMHGPHIALYCKSCRARYGGVNYWLPRSAVSS